MLGRSNGPGEQQELASCGKYRVAPLFEHDMEGYRDRGKVSFVVTNTSLATTTTTTTPRPSPSP